MRVGCAGAAAGVPVVASALARRWSGRRGGVARWRVGWRRRCGRLPMWGRGGVAAVPPWDGPPGALLVCPFLWFGRMVLFSFFLCAWRLAPRRPPRVQLCWWSGWGDCRRGEGDARATAVMGARGWPPTRWARWLGGYRHGTVRVAALRRLSWPSRQVPRTPRVLHAACPARGMAAPLSIRVACARRWAPR